MKTKPVAAAGDIVEDESKDSYSHTVADVESTSISVSGFDVPAFDLIQKCPVITTVASTEKEMCTTSEIEILQFELEKTICQCILRSRKYKQAVSVIEDGVWARDEKPSVFSKHASSTINSKARLKNADVGKRSGSHASSALKIRPPKIQKSEHVTISERNATSPGSSRSHLWPQNQIPTKFLDFVSLFAEPVSVQDVSLLRSLIEGSATMTTSALPSPTKKPIYANKGVKKNELVQSGKPSLKKCGRPGKRPRLNEDPCPVVTKLGSFTEHLIQAMISEHTFAFGESNLKLKELPQSNFTIRSFVKSLNMGNLSTLERLIQQELEYQGLIDCDVIHLAKEDKQNDEVSEELRRRKKELALVQHSNLRSLSLLVKKAENALAHTELAAIFKRADDELVELSCRLCEPSSKRVASKKDREALLKALVKRNDAARLLDAFEPS